MFQVIWNSMLNLPYFYMNQQKKEEKSPCQWRFPSFSFTKGSQLSP